MPRKPDPPAILISDHTTTPPLTLHYHLARNEISLLETYKTLTHLARTSTAPPPPETLTLTELLALRTTFHTTLWRTAATLLDYLSDFAALDTPPMQSLWFDLLDTWRAAAESPLARAWEADGVVAKAVRVMRDVLGSSGAEVVVFPVPQMGVQSGIRQPRVSGLGGWAQWIAAGSPGVRRLWDGGVVEFDERDEASLSLSYAYYDDEEEVDDDDDDDDEGEEGGGDEETTENTTTILPILPPFTPSTRYIPHPAIALMDRTTAQLRYLTHRLTRHLPRARHLAIVSAFDARKLEFPVHPVPPTGTTASPNVDVSADAAYEPHTTPHGTLAYRLLPAEASDGRFIARYPGFSDASLLVEAPGCGLVSEGMGIYLGERAYVGASGQVGGFDVWAVDAVGEKGVGVGEGMFEEWVLE